MADYKDAQDVVPHKFYKSPLVISNDNYNINVNGLNSVGASPAVPRSTSEAVADGFAQIVINPSQVKTFTFETAAAADTEDDLWALLESGEPFTFSYTDPNSELFNVSGKQCQFVQKPALTRNGDKPMHSWEVICNYGKMRGGAFRRAV